MKETKTESANLDLDIHLACIVLLTYVKKRNRKGKTHYIRNNTIGARVVLVLLFTLMAPYF